MGITQLFTKKDFYTTVDPKTFQVGQICWVPVPNPDPIPRILDVERKSGNVHEEVQFEIRMANRKDDFRKRDRSLPIKYLELRSHEELLIQKCKKRQVVILATDVDCYPDISKMLPSMGKKHQQQNCIFVVPCYSGQVGEYGSGIIEPIMTRSKCLLYRQFFYLYPQNGSKEMLARFDRLRVVIDRGPASIEPTNIALSKDVFNVFLSMFLFCMSGKASEELKTIISLIREAYPK